MIKDKTTSHRKYTIQWIEVEKEQFFSDYKPFQNEGPTIYLPFIKHDIMDYVEYRGKSYLCNDPNLKSYTKIYTSDEISGIPDNIIYTPGCLVSGILLQQDFHNYWNPYELFFYYNKIYNDYIETKWTTAEKWIELMTWSIWIIYGVEASETFYKNANTFVTETEITFKEILMNTMHFMESEMTKSKEN